MRRFLTAVLVFAMLFAFACPSYAYTPKIEKAELVFEYKDGKFKTVDHLLDNTHMFFLPSFCTECDASVTLFYSSGKTEETAVRLVPGEKLAVKTGQAEYAFDTIKSENIPALYVELAEDGTLSKLNGRNKPAIAGNMTLIDREGKVCGSGEMKQIKGRGNMSWDMPKKGYGIKLSQGADLLGMGKDKNWVLIPDYRDSSLLNFMLVNTLASACGMTFAQQSRWTDLYINGEYLGVYMLTEKMEIGNERIDIRDLEKQTEAINEKAPEDCGRITVKPLKGRSSNGKAWKIENEPEDNTGGYLLELDTYDKSRDEKSLVTTDKGLIFSVKSPEYTTVAQMEYIIGFMQDMEDALYSKTGCNNKGKHFSEYIDMESFALLWLLDEFGMEIDICSSHYFWKDSDLSGDGKLHACAPWDVEHYFKREYYKTNYLTNNGAPKRFWQNMYNLHPEFKAEVCRVWQEKLYPALQALLDSENKTGIYEGVCFYGTYTGFIETAAGMNHARWPYALKKKVDDRPCKTWDDEIIYVQKYLAGRTEYLNSVFGAAQ